MGSDVKRIQKSEKYNLKLIRRKAVAMHDMKRYENFKERFKMGESYKEGLLIILKKNN